MTWTILLLQHCSASWFHLQQESQDYTDYILEKLKATSIAIYQNTREPLKFNNAIWKSEFSAAKKKKKRKKAEHMSINLFTQGV